MKMKTDDRIGHVPADKLLLPNTLLLGEIEEMLADGRTVMLKAKGGSMFPFIVGGRDSVLIRRPSGINPLRTGQIVLAHLSDNRYVLHRIIRMDGIQMVLMGDGNLRETESCRFSDIVGIVTKIIRKGRYVDSDARLERYKAKVWGKSLPIRRYLLYLYRRIWKQ